MKKCFVPLLILAAGLGVTQPQRANAALVTFNFSGFLTSLNLSGFVDPRDSNLWIGAPFTGTLQYDTLTRSLGGGLYRPDVPPQSGSIDFQLNVNGNFYLYATAPGGGGNIGWIQVTDSSPDSFYAYAESVPSGGSIALTLLDYKGTALSSDLLPASLNIHDWDTATVAVTAPWGTSFSGMMIPEPSVMSLAVLGAWPLIACYRRRLKQPGRSVP
jgi:hypothetical protein